MCGEYRPKLELEKRVAGSPPHVWRILIKVGVKFGSSTITSTCVENTIIEMY